MHGECKAQRAEGVLEEGEVSSVPPARGSHLVRIGIWKSHQNGEPWKWWFLQCY